MQQLITLQSGLVYHGGGEVSESKRILKYKQKCIPLFNLYSNHKGE